MSSGNGERRRIRSVVLPGNNSCRREWQKLPITSRFAPKHGVVALQRVCYAHLPRSLTAIKGSHLDSNVLIRSIDNTTGSAGVDASPWPVQTVLNTATTTAWCKVDRDAAGKK